MASLLRRLIRIAKAAMPRPREDWGAGPTWKPGARWGGSGEGEARFKAGTRQGGVSTPTRPPDPVAEDLAVFGLAPPASLEAVRKARNREIRKYHSDRFLSDPERFEISKQIMQILNAAYERLETHYKKKGDEKGGTP